MYRPLTPVFALVIFAVSAFSQIPTPTPKTDDDVVKISTNLIQIDVTVTDKKGNVVRDLKPGDFEIYQNGKRQDITNFTFISNVRESPVTERPAEKKPAAILPPAPVRPEQVRRSIALIVDDLSMSFESVYQARRAMKKFVDEQMRDGDLVAIIRTGSGMGALQQFTNDKRQLYAAIERVRWNPIGTGKVGVFAPMDAKVDLGPTPEPQPGERTLEGIQREQESFRADIFATGTLGAINYVVRGMQELPGRKSVLLISDGFRLYEEDALGFRQTGRVLDSLRRLVDAANRASVVIYTMDARGLVYTGLTAADNTGGRSPQEIEQQLSDRRNQLIDTQDGLRYLAVQTGGVSIFNNNDLVGGIRRILDDQSYYLIGYLPDEETFNPRLSRFNRLQVKVNRPGLNVRYRSGFFGVTDEKMQTVASGPTGTKKLLHALTSPFGSGQVPVRMNAIFNSTPDGKYYVRSLLHFNLRELEFREMPDKSRQAVIDVLAIAFGDNGMVVEQSAKTFTLTISADQYEKYLKEGLVHNFTFPVKKPGAYQVRLALRDHATDKVGSANQFVEIPNIKKDRIVLSGVVLENQTLEDWKAQSSSGQSVPTTVWADTSTRQFRSGTVLNYGYTAFNPKPGSLESGNLETQVRIFRDGSLIFESKPKKAVSGKVHPKAVDLGGSLMLGSEMKPGDYVLQITVTDKLAKPKNNSATQFVQFEILP